MLRVFENEEAVLSVEATTMASRLEEEFADGGDNGWKEVEGEKRERWELVGGD